MKECIKCHDIFPLTSKFFGIRKDSPDGFRNDCKVCVKKRRDAWHIKNRVNQLLKMKNNWYENREKRLVEKREYNCVNRGILIKKCHVYYENNREALLAQMREFRDNNKEKINHRRREQRIENYESYMKVSNEYNKKNRERIRVRSRKYRAKKRRTDPYYRLLSNLRSRISLALRKAKKTDKTIKLIGCTIPELETHLAKQFQPGMSMENYGQWHVDHKIPCAVFDLSDPRQQKECFNYTNLQPLWAEDNLKKGSKMLKEMAF